MTELMSRNERTKKKTRDGWEKESIDLFRPIRIQTTLGLLVFRSTKTFFSIFLCLCLPFVLMRRSFLFRHFRWYCVTPRSDTPYSGHKFDFAPFGLLCAVLLVCPSHVHRIGFSTIEFDLFGGFEHYRCQFLAVDAASAFYHLLLLSNSPYIQCVCVCVCAAIVGCTCFIGLLFLFVIRLRPIPYEIFIRIVFFPKWAFACCDANERNEKVNPNVFSLSD